MATRSALDNTRGDLSLDTILNKFNNMELAVSTIKESHDEIKTMLRMLMANQKSDTTDIAPPTEICKRLDESYVLCDANEYGKGLMNNDGERNSFLNVIIQSLWHLIPFKDEFFRRISSGHVRVGEPCVTCALYDIFIALSTISTDGGGKVVDPTSLRVALSNLCRASKMFQEGEMNDASEVLELILTCLHKSINVSLPVDSDIESEDNTRNGSSWDCNNGSCIVHSIFGMDVVDKIKCFCGVGSKPRKYTSFFHHVSARALRIITAMYPKESFSKILDMIDELDLLRCDRDAGGCGYNKSIRHFVCRQPRVFTLVIGWAKPCDYPKYIRETLAVISTEVDISLMYVNGVTQSRHRLVSVVCYCNQFYSCFCYSERHAHWIWYADEAIEVIGSWSDVVTMWGNCLMQPQILFFEMVC